MTNKILVVDLEATCWEDDGEFQKQNSEIIEIGICMLDTKTRLITAHQGILVKPYKSEVSAFCTKLTTITPQMLAQSGTSLKEACKMISDQYNSKQLTWASYGGYDKVFLREQCNKFNVDYCMSNDHINIKTLLSRKLGIDKGLGMKKALATLKIPLEGTHHRGVDDANNAAKILSWILNN